MKTVKINLYSFKELSKKIQEEVISHFQDTALEYNWWESVYEDAKEIGLQLGEFDMDSASFVRGLKGEFIIGIGEVHERILENHGKDCDTYKTAMKYKHSFQLCSDECDETELEETEDNLLRDLLRNYQDMLQEETEQLCSEEYAKETIQANDYLFYKDGKIAPVMKHVGKDNKIEKTVFNFHGQTISL